MEVRANILGLGRIGIGSWTYPWAVGTVSDRRPQQPMSPSGLVRQTAELGAKVVQLADNLPLDELTSAELKDLRKLSQDYGIDLQVGTRGVGRSHLLRYLEIALQLEARLIRTMESSQGLPAPISEIEKNVSLVLPEFVQAGVSIALENYEAYSTSDLAHLINTPGPPS